jgi:TIR domain
MSYARFDDEHDGGALSSLREELSAEAHPRTGVLLPIFQDVEGIRWGDDWETEITRAVNDASMLIPVVTPSFLTRDWCRREVFFFDRGARRQGVRLIFPLYYIQAPEFEDIDAQRSDEVIRILQRHN